MEGIVDRTVYSAIPPKVEYSLSEYGRTLIPVAEVMCAWGKIIISGNMKSPYHKHGSMNLYTITITESKSCHGNSGSFF